MKASNKGLLPAAIAYACSLLAVYSPAYANPIALTEVNDLLPGNKQNLRVVDNKLRFMSSYSDGIPQPFTLDQNGVLEAVPYTSEEIDFALEDEGLRTLIGGRIFYRLQSSSVADELYTRIMVQDINGPELLLELPLYDNLDPASDGTQNSRPDIQALYEKDGNLTAEVHRRLYDDTTGDAVLEITLYSINANTGEVLATEEVAAIDFPTPAGVGAPEVNNSKGSRFEFNNNTYQIGITDEYGMELWKIGPGKSYAEITMLADINPGPASSYISNYVEMNGAVYFLANASGLGGREVWKLDADDKVQRVADINPNGPAISGWAAGSVFHVYNNELYFLANHPDYGKELWKSDGTEQGTALVTEAFPAAQGAKGTVPWPSIKLIDSDYLGETLKVGFDAADGFFYRLQDSEGVIHLWHTDGTADGTRYVMTEPYAYDAWDKLHVSSVKDYFIIDGSFFVVYEDSLNENYELWQLSDGNELNPEKLISAEQIVLFEEGRDFNDQDLLDKVKHFTDSVLLRVVQPDEEQLWTLTGSAGELNKIISLTHDGEPARNAFFAAKSDDKTFFVAYMLSTGEEMWVTDYTEAGTHLIKDTLPGGLSGTARAAGYNYNPNYKAYYHENRTVHNGKLYYYAEETNFLNRLWETDGTEAGTKEVSSDAYGQWPDSLLTTFVSQADPKRFAFYNGSLYIPGPRRIGTVYDHQLNWSALYKYTPESSNTAPPGTGVLGDYVWQDTDGDGLQSSDEFGLEGVLVELQSCDGTFVASTTTDSMGAYRFENLAQDNFQLQFNLPAGFTFSPEEAGSSYLLDSNANQTTGVSLCYDMSQGYKRLAVDAGMVPTDGDTRHGSIGNYVWSDTNGDGVQDADEPGLAGVTVNLWQGCTSSNVLTTTTDQNGAFLFDNLPVDDYRLEFITPNGYTLSPNYAAGDYTRDSNPDPSTGLDKCQTLAEGQVRHALDAGFTPDGDTLTAKQAVYYSANNKLWLKALSDAEPEGVATLTATAVTDGVETTLGKIYWKSHKSAYQHMFKNVTQVPDKIIVTSDMGGSVVVDVVVK